VKPHNAEEGAAVLKALWYAVDHSSADFTFGPLDGNQIVTDGFTLEGDVESLRAVLLASGAEVTDA